MLLRIHHPSDVALDRGIGAVPGFALPRRPLVDGSIFLDYGIKPGRHRVILATMGSSRDLGDVCR